MTAKDSLKIICPGCREGLGSGKDISSFCPHCRFEVRNIYGIPILRGMDDSLRLDYTGDDTLAPFDVSKDWFDFIVKAIDSGRLVLELGSGRNTCCAPNLVKTDAFIYSMEIDYVIDAHGLPFPGDTFDYVCSTAVFEHLHSPWQAAQEIYRVLKPGGQVYVVSAFNQRVHGYPDHYFNMTDMGLRRIFSNFEILECEPAKQATFLCFADTLSEFSILTKKLVERMKEKGSNFDSASSLDEAVRASINGITEMYHELVVDLDEESREAWRKIAPGFHLIASKPRGSRSDQ